MPGFEITPLAFGFAPSDAAIIAVVVLVLFGGSKLATMGKSLGEGIREFKRATKDDDTTTVEPVAKTPAAAADDEEKHK